MTIAPIRHALTVKAPPGRAFERFTRGMVHWWPKEHHTGEAPFEEIVIEPRVEGRWFERDAQGRETQWGKVLAWDPPGRLVLGWQLDASFKFNAALVTEVELTFAAEGTGTRVTFEHRNLERYGDSAAKLAELLGGGWPGILQSFANSINTIVEE